MKLIFLSFSEVRNNVFGGMMKVLLPVINYFTRNNEDGTVCYVLYTDGKSNISIKTLNTILYLFLKTLGRFCKYILRLKSYKTRYILGEIYDYFAAKKIKEGVILVNTTTLKRTLVKNKKKNGINILLWGNPNDIEIYRIYKEEQKKYSVVLDDAYTYKKRLGRYRDTLSYSDHIIALTQVAYDSLVKTLDKSKISLCFYPLFSSVKPLEVDVRKNDKLTFCYVAHPFWLKGLPYLLEAWSKIDYNHVVLRVAGHIDLTLQKFINDRYSSLKNVEYLGWVPDLNRFFRSSHVCIIPSLLDAGPQTILEAMACRLPVIASKGCGFHVLIKDGVNGFCVPPFDADEIYKKIAWFINNQNRISVMGDAAFETIQNENKKDFVSSLQEHVAAIVRHYQVMSL